MPNVEPDPGFSALWEWFEQNKGLPIGEQIKQNPSKIQRAIPTAATDSDGVSFFRSVANFSYRKVFEPFQDSRTCHNRCFR